MSQLHKTVQSMDPGRHEGVRCPTCGQVFSLIADETRISRTRAGQMVAHFRLLEVVGQGAFGVVWRARDTELDRIVAIKTPRYGSPVRRTSPTSVWQNGRSVI